MADQTVHVVAQFVARAGQVEALKALLLTPIEPSRGEAGCIQYDMLQGSDAPERFTFVERWRDAAVFEQHLAMPYIQSVLEKLPGLIEGEPDIRTYAQVR